MDRFNPYFGTNIDLFNFVNVSKKHIVYAKYPINNFRIGYNHACREEFTQEFADRIHEYDYYCVPLASLRVNGITLVTNSTLSMRSSSLSDSELLSNKDTRDELKLTLDYILGILGVCISYGNEEKVRRQLSKKARAKSTSIRRAIGFDNPYIIKYYTLSPFWASSTPLMSLFLGIARNCYSAALDDCVDVNELVLSKVPKEEIYRIINEVDYKSALRVYKNVIVSFYDSNMVERSADLMLTPERRYTFEKMIKKGYQSLFPPFKTSEYWNNEEDPYDHGWYWYTDT